MEFATGHCARRHENDFSRRRFRDPSHLAETTTMVIGSDRASILRRPRLDGVLFLTFFLVRLTFGILSGAGMRSGVRARPRASSGQAWSWLALRFTRRDDGAR